MSLRAFLRRAGTTLWKRGMKRRLKLNKPAYKADGKADEGNDDEEEQKGIARDRADKAAYPGDRRRNQG